MIKVELKRLGNNKDIDKQKYELIKCVARKIFFSTFLGSSGWSNNQIGMKAISKRKTS